MVASIVKPGARALLFCMLASVAGLANAGGGGGGGGGGGTVGTSACLGTNSEKACLGVGFSVNPVRPGGRVKVTETVTGVYKPTSSRLFDLTVTLDNGATLDTLVADPLIWYDCTIFSVSSFRCRTDKLDQANPRSLSYWVTVPGSGQTRITSDFGWNGKSGTLLTDIPTSASGGSTVPAGTNGQTSAGNCANVGTTEDICATVTASPAGQDYNLSAGIDTGGYDRSAPPADSGRCNLGFFQANSAAAPNLTALCRDGYILPNLGVPLLLSGNPQRWITVNAATDQVLTLTITMRLRGENVSALEDIPGQSVYPWPMFFANASYTAMKMSQTRCATNNNTPPCLISATHNTAGNYWEWSFLYTNDETVFNNLASAKPNPLRSMLALMDFVIHPVGAQTIRPPAKFS